MKKLSKAQLEWRTLRSLRRLGLAFSNGWNWTLTAQGLHACATTLVGED